MAESIQNRKAQQAALRTNQQEQLQKKRELASQQKDDLQSIKSYYADKSRELDGHSEAAVNHIRAEAQDPQSNNNEQKTVYNRKAKTEPIIQNYETKETDRFYKVQDRGSRLSDTGNTYVIEAYAPEHEQNNLRVSVQKNKAVISGQRKHADQVDEGNKKISTNNFQTFREEFKFDRPVSHEGMTRERIGDYVRFSIPKLEAIQEPDET